MRRVVTLFEARGAEQIRAQMGTMQSSFSQGRRELESFNRTSGYVNNQLRALGTTLRYTFAGTAIFGSMQMIRNLGEFQAKLGEIQAIASGPNGLPLLDTQIDDLGNMLIDVSNRTTAPIEDLQQGVIALYSTIGNVPPNEAADMMEVISETAITAQSGIEDTTQALLGMIDAFGGGTDQLGKYGDEFYRVIKLSAGMSGHIYAQQLGRLQSSATLSGFDPETMGALAVGATRFGGSAATNMRGLAQLMTFVMNPSGKSTEQAFAGIGLGRAERNRLGGPEVLRRVLAEVNRRGVTGNPRRLTDDMTSQLEETFPNGAPNTALGISGQGSQLLAALFPRIEGRRIAAVLAKLQTPDQVAGTPNQTIDQYLDEIKNGADGIDDAMGRAMDYRRIQQAGNAMHNFGIEVGTAISPLLQYPARGITAAASGFNNQHWNLGRVGLPGVTGQEVEVGGGVVGTLALLRLLRGGGRGVNAIRGAGMLGAGADLLTQTERGHTPANPLYVAVVYSLSGWGPNAGGRMPGNAPTGPGPFGAPGGRIGPPEAPGSARTLGRGARISRSLGQSAGYLPFVMAGVSLETAALEMGGPGEPAISAMTRGKGFPLSRYLTGRYNKALQAGPGVQGAIEGLGITPAERDMITRIAQGKISQAAGESRLRALATPAQLAGAGVNVKGKAEITIKDERTKKVHHVTTDLYPDFTVPAPMTKAKNKTYRGGQ